MTARPDKKKEQEDYIAFRAIKDVSGALAFLKERLPNPVGKPYYTPSDYRWFVMPLKYRLRDANDKRWYSLWGLLHQGIKLKDDAEYEKSEGLVVRAITRETNYLDDWVKSRYAISAHSYLMPHKFGLCKAEDWEGWARVDNLDQIEEAEAKGLASDILYYWKKVKPERENPDDERRHIILRDRTTHLEAPLLPGQEPYHEG